MSRLDKIIVFVGASLATAFVSLWLPQDNQILHVSVIAFTLWILASPVFQWRRWWPLPLSAALAGVLTLVRVPSIIEYAIPVAIAVGLVIRGLQRRRTAE
jgi:hypothetical protein